MRDVKFSDIKVLVEFMYKGEINIDHVSATGMILPKLSISSTAIRDSKFQRKERKKENYGAVAALRLCAFARTGNDPR